MTCIGKTTLAQTLLDTLLSKLFTDTAPSQLPIIYVKAPADGERSLSWTSLYARILHAANEPLTQKKRVNEITDDRRQITSISRRGLQVLRSAIESLLINRNVRVLIVDEALHLLRFSNYSAVMDTLKSIADIHSTKLLLIGPYETAELVQEYGQVARRSEILHYRRYRDEVKADKDEFMRVVALLQSLWPCKEVPNLVALGDELMKATLGSIGLLKQFMLKLACLQMKAKGERFSLNMLHKAGKSRKSLEKIEREATRGEEVLSGATYGESYFADGDVFVEVVKRLRTSNEFHAA
jgi:hypothetical protein